MPYDVKLGKKAARHDAKVKRLSVVAPSLPAPPNDTNWYAAVSSWAMLGNDQVGDCVEAATLHAIQQFSVYAGNPLAPTQIEALAFYSAATGYNPEDPNTDQGSYVMGPGGTMQYWTNTGVMCGGQLNKVHSFLQITHKNPTEWMQGVYLFGGIMTGLQLPESIVSGNQPPSVWTDFTGSVAGGHEVWINGYETLNSGRVYDLVSWGQMFRATEEFLMNVVDEMVVMIDPAEFNARGLDAQNVDLASLLTDLGEMS